jgi:branched-chain amino acid transport system substrate-binding protein
MSPHAPQPDPSLSRRGFLVGLGVVAAGSLVACDQKPEEKPKPSSSSTQPTSDPIKIGAFLSISGAQSEQARQLKLGFTLAVDEVNKAGGLLGRPVELVITDTRGKQDLTGSGVIRLITSDKVVGLLGECSSSLSIIGGQVAQSYKIPMISPTSTNPKVSQIGDMVYTVAFVDTFQGAICARFAIEELKAKTAAVLYDQKQTYCVGLRDAFEKSFTQLGGKIAVEQSYTTGDAEFGPQLINIKRAKPDILFISAYSQDAALIAQQMKNQELALPTLGGDGLDSPDFGTAARGAAEGWYATSFFADGDQSPQGIAFAKEFQAKAGEPPCASSVQGLDSARVLLDAIKRACTTDGAAVAQAIAQTKNFPSATGAFSMGPGRTADKPALVMKLTDNHWRKAAQYPGGASGANG